MDDPPQQCVRYLDTSHGRWYEYRREAIGVTPFVPKSLTSGAKAEGRFGKQDFLYIPEDDTYRCPAGERLTRRYTSVEHGMDLHGLLDHRLPSLSVEIPMHNRHGAAHQALGA